MSAERLYRERPEGEVVSFSTRERLVFRESDGSEFRFGFLAGALTVAAAGCFLACWLFGHHVVMFQ